MKAKNIKWTPKRDGTLDGKDAFGTIIYMVYPDASEHSIWASYRVGFGLIRKHKGCSKTRQGAIAMAERDWQRFILGNVRKETPGIGDEAKPGNETTFHRGGEQAYSATEHATGQGV